MVVSIWWLSGTRIHPIIATSQRLGMSAHQKRCSDGSFSWNEIRWLCRGSFSNKNTRVSPVKKQILDLYKPFVKWPQRSPDLVFINMFLWQPGRQVDRATSFWKKAFNICGPLVWNWLHRNLQVSSIWEVTPPTFLDNLCTCVLWGFLKRTTCSPSDVDNTDMLHLTTRMRSEKCVVRRFRRRANVYLHKPR